MKNNNMVTAIRCSPEESARLQRAWTQSGQYANRTQFIKAAVNAFAEQPVFIGE